MTVDIVLFDADGVIQQPPGNWRGQWGSLIEDPQGLDRFMADIFAAEAPHLDGSPGLADSVQRVLDRWGSRRPVEDALALWTLIEPAHDMLGVVRATRAAGTLVGLATNQQPHRYAFMEQAFGYPAEFDHVFVSCRLGVAKPAIAYFEKIAQRLDRDETDMLFIDDNVANVESARRVGLRAEVFHLREGRDALISRLRQHGVALDQ